MLSCVFFIRFMVSGLIFVFKPFRVIVLWVVYDRGPVSFFCRRKFSFPAPFTGETPVPIVPSWQPCCRSIDCLGVDLSVGSWFCSIGLHVSVGLFFLFLWKFCASWNLGKECTDSIDVFLCNMDILMLILPVHEHRVSFHLFVTSVSFISLIVFSVQIFHLFNKFIPNILLVLMLSWMWLFYLSFSGILLYSVYSVYSLLQGLHHCTKAHQSRTRVPISPHAC